MGRAFDSNEELDRPDLNKCPDCGCFFAGDDCPLCGKVCPEEMRAGNRKPVKKKKQRRGSSGRVIFVEWYHSWWFIIVMLAVFPILGIILLATSPHKKGLKIGIIAVGAAYMLVSYFGISNLLGSISKLWDKPVDTSLSKDDYIAACETVDGEDFYRSPDSYKDSFVCLTLTVKERITDADAYYNGEKYDSYYVCSSKSDASFTVLIRDCSQDGAKNFLTGDTLTVYGEGDGNREIYAMDGTLYSAPCVNAAYIMLS